MNTDIWTFLKRAGIVLAILIPSAGWLVSTVRYRVIVDNLKASDEKQEERWDEQQEINGKFITLYEFFIDRPRGSAEENEEEGTP